MEIYCYLDSNINTKTTPTGILTNTQPKLTSTDMLQCMLDARLQYCCYWDLKLNVPKFNAIVFSEGPNLALPDMFLGVGVLQWIKEIKYLGVCMSYRNGLKFNVNYNCRKCLGCFV
jgi:hypothetical protein